jgi:ABC-type sugar transport system permease subunit
MKLSGKAWMSLAIMFVAAGVIISALRWPFRAALFPMVVGFPLFILSTIQFVKSAFHEKGHSKAATIDFKLSEMEDKALEKKRTINICLWTLGFFFMVLLIGFPIAVPLFVFLYMKLQGKEKWGTSLILTFVAWASFYGLFVKFCDVPFMEGWVQQGLRALGIL